MPFVTALVTSKIAAGTRTGPEATGPAAPAPCQAFIRGGFDMSSIAYKSLTIAAAAQTRYRRSRSDHPLYWNATEVSRAAAQRGGR